MRTGLVFLVKTVWIQTVQQRLQQKNPQTASVPGARIEENRSPFAPATRRRVLGDASASTARTVVQVTLTACWNQATLEGNRVQTEGPTQWPDHTCSARRYSIFWDPTIRQNARHATGPNVTGTAERLRTWTMSTTQFKRRPQ